MWKNKHVIIALLVAPILAVIAWFVVDRMVAEEPQAAVEGGAYELVARPNCRYASGACGLVNNDFELELTLVDGVMQLAASHALDNVQLATAVAGQDFNQPQPFEPADDSGQSWQLRVGLVPASGAMRVLASTGGASYYAESSLAFTASE